MRHMSTSMNLNFNLHMFFIYFQMMSSLSIFIILSPLAISMFRIEAKTSLLVASVKGRRLRKTPYWCTLSGFDEMFDALTSGSKIEYFSYLRAFSAMETSWVLFDNARSEFGYLIFDLIDSKKATREKARLFQNAKDKLCESAAMARGVLEPSSRVILREQAEWLEQYYVQWCAFVSLIKSLRIEDKAVCTKAGLGLHAFMAAQRSVQSKMGTMLDAALDSCVKVDDEMASALKSTYLRADTRLLELLAGICGGAKIDHDTLVVQLSILDTLASSIIRCDPKIDGHLFSQRGTDLKRVLKIWKSLGALKEEPHARHFKYMLIFQIRAAKTSLKCFQ